MKLNDPRSTLVAGLSLALSLISSPSALKATDSYGRPMKMAQATLDTVPGRTLGTPVPGSSTLPPLPSTTAQPGPIPTNPNSATPADPDSKPALAPVARPPLGMLYGEQELLDGKKAAQRSASSPSGPSQPMTAVPPTIGAPPSESVPVQSIVPLDTVIQYPMTDRFGYAPPPGTLGQTYKRRTRLIEETKHPRVGVVEVNLPENVDVSARGLKTKWTGKVWRLESDPLLPGIPHIYEIKASWGEGTEPQYRTIRLIMGRIVDLDF